MARVIYGGERELNLLTAGQPHPSMLEYMRHQTQRLSDYVQHTGSQFAQAVIDTYDTYYSDTAIRHGRAAIAKVHNFFREDTIRELITITDLQQANPMMVRFNMSQEDLRKKYQAGLCYGYGSVYVDPSPGKIGYEDYNWRRVMNGVVQLEPETEEAPDGNWKYEIIMEELMEGDRELELHEQTAILRTWDRIRRSMRSSLDDPSSPHGDMF